MNAETVLSLFVTLAILIAVFELLYWAITKGIGITINIPKPEVCGVFWLLFMFGIFLIAHKFPDPKMMVLGALVYAIHASYCNSFSLSRTKNSVTTPQQPTTPAAKPSAVIQQWTEDKPYDDK